MKKSERTKQKILQTALELMRQEGFDNCTMREIASRAEVATGAAYYYFRSKDEIVFAFYELLMRDMLSETEIIVKESSDFATRMRRYMLFRFEQLQAYRPALNGLVRNVVDKTSPLSAFSAESAHVRNESIRAMSLLMEGSDLRYPKSMRKQLPVLLWMYHMGILYYWLNDESENQGQSVKLVALTTSLGVLLLRVLRFPVAGRVLAPVLEFLEKYHLTETSTEEPDSGIPQY